MGTCGPQESRLLAVERGAESIERDLRALNVRLLALSQGIWAAWSDVAETGSPATCTTTYSGTLNDNCGNAVVGATIAANDHTTGAPLATTTSGAGGVFSQSITITSPSEAVDFVITAAGFPTKTISNVAISCSGYSLGTVTIGSGTATISNGCANFCAASTQTLVDSIYGKCTLTWNGSLWQGAHNGVSYPGYGGGSCSAATISITYQLLTGGNINVKWQVNGSFCPVASGTLVTITFSGSANCSGATPVITATNSSVSGELKNFRQGAASQTFTVTLA